MSAYVNINSLGFPFHEGDIRLLHPEIREDQTGDTFPCPPEFALVKENPPPEYDPTKQRLERSMPFNIDGVWQYTWTLIDLTPDEMTAYQTAKSNYEQMMANQNAQSNTTF